VPEGIRHQCPRSARAKESIESFSPICLISSEEVLSEQRPKLLFLLLLQQQTIQIYLSPFVQSPPTLNTCNVRASIINRLTHDLWWWEGSLFTPHGRARTGVAQRLRPEEIYSYMLAFNDTIAQAAVTLGYTVSTSDSIYNPDANSFQLNQMKLLEMDDIGRRFLSGEPPPWGAHNLPQLIVFLHKDHLGSWAVRPTRLFQTMAHAQLY